MIALVSLFSRGANAEEVIAEDETRRELGRALVRRGWDVTVVTETAFRGEAHDEGVRWIFVPAWGPVRALRRAMWWDRSPQIRTPTPHVLQVLRSLAPRLIHSFDAVFYPHLIGLGSLGVPVIAHFHGGRSARRAGWKAIERRAYARVDRLFVTAGVQAEGWVHNGFAGDRVHEVFETSVRLAPQREKGPPLSGHAEEHGGLRIVSVARLDAVKDPLTVLQGFRRLHAQQAAATLDLAWTEAPLYDAVLAEAGPGVRLHGRLPRDVARRLIASADVYVQASTREVCGVAVLEAMASGVPPAVSDIPAFRRVLGGCGALFPVGDPEALASAVLRASGSGPACRDRFDRELSFEALARTVSAHYTSLLSGASSR